MTSDDTLDNDVADTRARAVTAAATAMYGPLARLELLLCGPSGLGTPEAAVAVLDGLAAFATTSADLAEAVARAIVDAHTPGWPQPDIAQWPPAGGNGQNVAGARLYLAARSLLAGSVHMRTATSAMLDAVEYATGDKTGPVVRTSGLTGWRYITFPDEPARGSS